MVERIKQLCSEWGITIKSLEKVLELGNGTIRRWDESSPSIDKVKKVADFFGVSVSYLMGEENEKAPTHLGGGSVDAILDGMSNAELIEFISKASERLKNQ